MTASEDSKSISSTATLLQIATFSLLSALFLLGCAQLAESPENQSVRIHRLSEQMRALSPDANRQKIEQFSSIAVRTSSRLREQYQVNLSPWLHNIEVNSGIKSRGLCFHYARDLAQALQPVSAPDWQLYFVQVNPNAILEHNAIVVAPTGKSWRSGIVLDGWRNSGLLYFGPVMKDEYPWQIKNLISTISATNPATTTSGHQGY